MSPGGGGEGRGELGEELEGVERTDTDGDLPGRGAKGGLDKAEIVITGNH